MKIPRIKLFRNLLINLVILTIISLIVIFEFNSKKLVKAQNQIKIFPTNYQIESSGNITWQNPQNAFSQDLSENASFSDFNEENSAFIKEKIQEETTTTTTITSETTSTTESTPTITLPSETTTTSESTTTTTPLETTTTIETTTTTVPSETTTETTTTSVPPESTTTTKPTTTTTTEPQTTTTTTTEPISLFKKFWGLLTSIVKAEEKPIENQDISSSASIIFENFFIGDNLEKFQIQNAQLRFSLGGKGETGDKLIISYFYQDEWQDLGELDLSNEISNNTNGGYFLYSLPVFENQESLKNLKIRFTYSSSKFQIPDSKFSSVYLDSVWLEIDYNEGAQNLSLNKHDWKSDEEPEFDFTLPSKGNKFITFFKSLIGKNKLEVYLLDPDNLEIKEGISVLENKIKISKLNKNHFKPGLYKLIIKQDSQIITQDFSWGVLTINTNKSIYLPNETAYLQMAALNEAGHTICNAHLKLGITSPSGKISSPKINLSNDCGPDNVTDKPDYFAYYQLNEIGIYQMKLTNLDNGYEITDSFEVRDSIPFEVERIGPTRIYPPAKYEMKIKIKANQDFASEVKESVPNSFVISDQFPISNFQIISNDPNSKQLIWKVNWKAGESYELKYTFDAPDISPYLYLLGPLEFYQCQSAVAEDDNQCEPVIFVEQKQWQIAADAVSADDGTLVYGDTTNAGYIKIRDMTAVNTFASEINGPSSSGSNIVHVVIKSAPTRNEKMIGHLKVDGRLDIVKCTAVGAGDTTACDDMTSGAEDFISQWNNPGTTGTLDCDNTTPDSNVCYRAFDIAYEQLSGRAVVFYADNVPGKIYWCAYDGSSWSTTCGSPGSGNEINLSSYISGTPRWITAKSRGERLTSYRTNDILVGVADSNNDFVVFIWNGSSATNINLVTTNLSAYTPRNETAGVAWEEISGNAIAAWADDNSTAQSRYKKYTAGSGWDASDSQLFTQTAKGRWVQLSSDPLSNRIMYVVSEAVDEYKAAVWKADGSTPGWTANTEDTAMETTQGRQSSTAWERFTNQAWNGVNDSGTTGDSKYQTWTGSFGSLTSSGITTSDDALSVNVFPAYNSDYILLLVEDVDCDLYSQNWTGSAVGTAVADLETELSSYGVSCPNATAPTNGGVGQAYAFSYTPYSPWSRNWRWTDDMLNQTPSSWLANENTAPTDIPISEKNLRLRLNIAELGGKGQTDARKKLQYSTDQINWTDVDAQGGSGIWRYCDGPGTDDNNIPSTVLTGSTAVGPFVENGTAASTYDHSALAVAEWDFCIQSNNTATATTYYFRAYDNDQQTAVFRQQTPGTSYTYPSLTTTSSSNTAPVVSNVKLNNQQNIDLVENSTTTISATADLYDAQGCNTITSVTAKIYRSGVSGGKDCTPNENNCYSVSSCTISNCVGNYASTTCSFDMWFDADPTDNNTPWSSEYWRAYIEATDSGSLTGSGYSPSDAPEVNSLLALSVTGTVNYGSLNPGDKNDPLDKTTTVSATGNISLDVNLYGTNLCTDYPTCSGYTISVGQQHYSATSSTPYSNGTALQSSPGQDLDLNCPKTTDHTNLQTKNIYWGIQIPNPQHAGSYTGQINFTAIKNALPWP